MTRTFCDRCNELIPTVSDGSAVNYKMTIEDKRWHIWIYIGTDKIDYKNTVLCRLCRVELLKELVKALEEKEETK